MVKLGPPRVNNLDLVLYMTFTVKVKYSKLLKFCRNLLFIDRYDSNFDKLLIRL